MDTATCTEDDHSYTANEFSQLPSAELQRKRRQLICDDCGFVAFFRKPSRSGRGACFGARPHADGCEAAAADNEIRLPGGGTIRMRSTILAIELLWSWLLAPKSNSRMSMEIHAGLVVHVVVDMLERVVLDMDNYIVD